MQRRSRQSSEALGASSVEVSNPSLSRRRARSRLGLLECALFVATSSIFISIIVVALMQVNDTYQPKPNPQISNSLNIKEPVGATDVSKKASSDLQLNENTNNTKEVITSVTATNKDDDDYQLVFSTSCSNFQNWQSYMVFFHAYKIKQPGHVTRIASGCNDKEAKDLREFHKKSVSVMSDKFHLHISPEFRDLADGTMSRNYQVTKYFNKPYGLLHWMESIGYSEENMNGNNNKGDEVIILIDPDMLLLRPITGDFTNDESVRWVKEIHDIPRVEHGKPMASVYGYGNQPFTQLDLKKIFDKDSPALKVSNAEGRWYYPAGPPYIATGRDMYNIARVWTTVSPKVHEQYPHLLAEMFSYSIAAAHLKLPHQLSTSFMLSNPGSSSSEGWHLVDKPPAEEMCDWNPINPLPLVIHYCQRSLLGEWVITKYRLRKDFLSCDAPLLAEPPKDIALKYTYGINPPKKKGQEPGEQIPYSATTVKRHAFMLCNILPKFNQAAEYYKKYNCDDKANYNKSLYPFTDPW